MKKAAFIINLSVLLAAGCSNSMHVTGMIRCTGGNRWIIDTGTRIYSVDSSIGNAYNNRKITVTGHTDGDTEDGPFLDIHYIDDVQ